MCQVASKEKRGTGGSVGHILWPHFARTPEIVNSFEFFSFKAFVAFCSLVTLGHFVPVPLKVYTHYRFTLHNTFQ